MSLLEEELMGSEELDYEYDIDDEEKEALLARAPRHEDANDTLELGVEKVLQEINDNQDEKDDQSQPEHTAGSVHSRLGPRSSPSQENEYTQDENGGIEQNAEVGNTQSQQHPTGSVHSRLGPREPCSEQDDYEQEEIGDKQELHDDDQHHEVREELEKEEERDELEEEEDKSAEEDDDEDEDDDDDDEDESPRRGRFKSERFKSERSTIIPSTAPKQYAKIPDSLDEVVIKDDLENESSWRRGRGARGGRGWQNPDRRGRGMDWGRLGLQRAGPWNPQAAFNKLPEPSSPYGLQNERFQIDDFGPCDGIMFSSNNAGEAKKQQENQNSSKPTPLQQGKSSVWSRLGMAGPQTGVSAVAAPQMDQSMRMTPLAGAETTLHKRPHSDNATSSTANVKQMKLEIPHGKNVIGVLNEMFSNRIKWHERSIGTVHVPEFESSVEVQGQIYKGVARQKKEAKKKAAEAALIVLMQHGTMNNAGVAGQRLQIQNSSPVMTPQENKGFEKLQQKVVDTKNVPINNTGVAGQQQQNQNSTTTVRQENKAFQNFQQTVSGTKTDVTPVAALQAAKNTTVTPQNGTSSFGKNNLPVWAQPKSPLPRPQTEIKLELPSGKSASSILNEMYLSSGKIKYNEKALGNVMAPEFQYLIEVEGRTYTGVGKQKKVAKKNAAEITLLGLMQNWSKGIKPEHEMAQRILKPIMDAQLRQQPKTSISQQSFAEP